MRAAWGVVWGSGFRAQGSGFRVQGSGFRVQGSGFSVQGSGFRVFYSGFRVYSVDSEHPATPVSSIAILVSAPDVGFVFGGKRTGGFKGL